MSQKVSLKMATQSPGSCRSRALLRRQVLGLNGHSHFQYQPFMNVCLLQDRMSRPCPKQPNDPVPKWQPEAAKQIVGNHRNGRLHRRQHRDMSTGGGRKKDHTKNASASYLCHVRLTLALSFIDDPDLEICPLPSVRFRPEESETQNSFRRHCRSG